MVMDLKESKKHRRISRFNSPNYHKNNSSKDKIERKFLLSIKQQIIL